MKNKVFGVILAGTLILGGGLAMPTAVHANGISDILAIQREWSQQKATASEKQEGQKKESKKIIVKYESSNEKVSSYTPLLAVRTRGISDILEIMKERSINKQEKQSSDS